MKYDSGIIEQHAQALYSEADWIVFKCSFFGFVLGGFAGVIAAKFEGGSLGVFGLVGAIVGCVIGNGMGRTRAFQLRLQAQTALCHVQIERNTRGVLPATPQEPSTKESQAPVLVTSDVATNEQMGRCPNCDSIIPLNARECRKCIAQFGGRNMWAVKPL